MAEPFAEVFDDDFWDDFTLVDTITSRRGGVQRGNPYLDEMLQGLGIRRTQYEAWFEGRGTITDEQIEKLDWLREHVLDIVKNARQSRSIDKKQNVKKLVAYNIDEDTIGHPDQPLWYHYTGSVWSF